MTPKRPPPPVPPAVLQPRLQPPPVRWPQQSAAVAPPAILQRAQAPLPPPVRWPQRPAAAAPPAPVQPRMAPPAGPGRGVVQCGHLLTERGLTSKGAVLEYLSRGADPLKTKAAVKSEWNSENPRDAIKRSEWDFNTEKAKERAARPVPPVALPPAAAAAAAAVADAAAPPVAVPVPAAPSGARKRKRPVELAAASPDAPRRSAGDGGGGGGGGEGEGGDGGGAVVLWRHDPKKKKQKSPKKRAKVEAYTPGTVYSGPLGQFGISHLPKDHPRALARADKLQHRRRAKTTTIFTKKGYALAQTVIRERRDLVIVETIGRDVIVQDPISCLTLGIHVFEGGTIYPTEDNHKDYIVKQAA